MNAPSCRLLLLLRELAPATRMIRRDLPGWHPHVLQPALQATLEAVTKPGATRADFDLAANRLADILRRRPETAGIARVLEVGLVGSDGKVIEDLPPSTPLPDWVENECVVLIRKTVEELRDHEGPTSSEQGEGQ